MKLPRFFIGLVTSLAMAGCLFALSPSGLPEGKVELFLLAGQSNMSGRGAVADLAPEDAAIDPHVWALNSADAWQPAVDPLHWDKSATGVGAGKFFGRIVAAKEPGVIVALIPTACGGSPISTWTPGGYWVQTKSYPWDDSIARAKRAMRDGTLKAILWHQGESDSNPTDAPLYEERLTDLINRFRKELNAPDLPFIIGQLGRFDAEGRSWDSGRIEVDRAQRAVADKLPNVYFVPAEGLVSRGDKLHFSTASQKIFASRYAEAYFKSQTAR
ncbi:MAG: sialate O-acetylesterase [Opitutaceae bacterium]|jgi:hypothetical protein